MVLLKNVFQVSRNPVRKIKGFKMKVVIQNFAIKDNHKFH